MKNSEVTITGLTRIQANGLAILCEQGDIGELINDYLERIDLEEEKLTDTMATPDFDDSDDNVHHKVNFDL